MSESNEAQLARLDERLKAIMAELEKATTSRKDQYERLEAMGRSLLSIDNRVEKVENSLAANAPTIEEFITIKHKVVGAGVMGRWLWLAGGAVISFVFTMREALFTWLMKS